jgi:hypothetical protein
MTWDKTEVFERDVKPLIEQLAKKLAEHKMPAIVRVQHGLTEKQGLVSQIAEVEGLDVVCPPEILAAYLAMQEPIVQCMSLHAQNQITMELQRQAKVLEIKQPKLVVVGSIPQK